MAFGAVGSNQYSRKPTAPTWTVSSSLLISNYPPESWEYHIKNIDQWQLGDLARDPRCPKSLLLKLGRRPYSNIAADVAGNQNTPPRTLLRLATRAQSDQRTQKTLAANPSTPTAALLTIAQGAWDTDICGAILRHPNVNSRIVEAIYIGPGGKYSAVATECLNHPACPKALIIRMLASSKSADVRDIMRSPRITDKQLRTLYRSKRWDDDTRVLRCIAEHSSCPPDVLSALASHQDFFVRYAVVSNRNTPTASVQLLLRDPELWIAREASNHPNLPAATKAMFELAHS